MRRCNCNEGGEMNPMLSQAWLSQGRGEVPWKQWSCARDSMRNKKLHALTSTWTLFSLFWDIIDSPSTTGVFMEKYLLILQENALLRVYLPQFIQVLTKSMHHSRKSVCWYQPATSAAVTNFTAKIEDYSQNHLLSLDFFKTWFFSIPKNNEDINKESVSLSWKEKQFPLSLQLLEK